jgi:hypothetical protein
LIGHAEGTQKDCCQKMRHKDMFFSVSSPALSAHPTRLCWIIFPRGLLKSHSAYVFKTHTPKSSVLAFSVIDPYIYVIYQPLFHELQSINITIPCLCSHSKQVFGLLCLYTSKTLTPLLF